MITLSDSAAERIRSYLSRRGHGVGLRLRLQRTGCSGYSYMVDYADEQLDDDVSFADKGVSVLVSVDELGLLDGTHIDFVRDGLNEMFRFKNPNASAECGCGESVSF